MLKLQTSFVALKSWKSYWKINAQKSNEIFEWTKKFFTKTAHAVINLIDNVESAIDSKKFVCGVFIYLIKAFDTVDHNILVADQWFKFYLKIENSLRLSMVPNLN